MNKIEELAEPPRVESPLPRKRKRPAARVIDSDSDSDFGADQKIPRYVQFGPKRSAYNHAVCPRSSYAFYIVTYYTKCPSVLSMQYTCIFT